MGVADLDQVLDVLAGQKVHIQVGKHVCTLNVLAHDDDGVHVGTGH